MTTLSTAALTLIAAKIREAGNNPSTARITADNIRNLCATDEGQEILRLIVRDDLAGASDVIVSALWFDL